MDYLYELLNMNIHTDSLSQHSVWRKGWQGKRRKERMRQIRGDRVEQLQVSAAMLMRSLLFWGITQRQVVILD
jgi:hypothetical protein